MQKIWRKLNPNYLCFFVKGSQQNTWNNQALQVAKKVPPQVVGLLARLITQGALLIEKHQDAHLIRCDLG